jgi:hypothetical protein
VLSRAPGVRALLVALPAAGASSRSSAGWGISVPGMGMAAP